MVLFNKSDFLNEDQRRHWAEYFKKRNDGLKVVFFSALGEAIVKDDGKDNSDEVRRTMAFLNACSVLVFGIFQCHSMGKAYELLLDFRDLFVFNASIGNSGVPVKCGVLNYRPDVSIPSVAQ